MTFRVVIQPRAERDIWAAAQWIEDQSASSAKALRWARGVRAKIATLKVHPKRCPVDPDSDAFGEEVRVLLYGKRQGKYRILFSIRGDTVHVLTVRHAARRSIAEEVEQDEAEGDRGPVD
ncbi:MAG TPA: type II toxin-antitoxin system RelE/ParE family toxin [Candidatus Methylomirabilis sp.]|jgi:plasmid stabilization system protein ParE|nr:type II toxin-antitoxin system RelE/ParE family toxin [Candidatus Methylomirabilis sp.]